MTVGESKLKKKGKQVTVMSDIMRKFINFYEKFKAYFEEKLK
jgi:hypothetical protein